MSNAKTTSIKQLLRNICSHGSISCKDTSKNSSFKAKGYIKLHCQPFTNVDMTFFLSLFIVYIEKCVCFRISTFTANLTYIICEFILTLLA